MNLEQLIAEHQLSPYTDRILAVAKECIVCSAGEKGAAGAGDDPHAGPGTRVGGYPVVPKGFGWPMKNDRPLEFILQLDCAELNAVVAGAGGPSPYPAAGLLSFFYDNVHWGYDQKDEGFVRVFHFPDRAVLVPLEPPEFEQTSWFGFRKSPAALEPYRVCTLRFVRKLSLPSLERGRLSLANEADEESYYELLATTEPFIQLGGWPIAVQSDDMEEEVARLLSRGNADDWELLLQVGDSAGTNMMWGDAGKLYFWIHKEDLAASRFDRVWLICQSH